MEKKLTQFTPFLKCIYLKVNTEIMKHVDTIRSAYVNKGWYTLIKYKRRFVRVCKLMNGLMTDHAKLRTDISPPVQISRTEKWRTVICPDVPVAFVI